MATLNAAAADALGQAPAGTVHACTDITGFGLLGHGSEMAVASGVALMEIVSKPDMRSPEEAGAYVTKLRAIVRYLGTCDGNMDEGSMRCDVNVSVRKAGEEYRTRCEVKNVNSVRFVMQAVEAEARRQAALQLGVFRRGGLPVGEHRPQDVEELVRVRHVPLVQGEVVLQQRLAETFHADELAVADAELQAVAVGVARELAPHRYLRARSTAANGLLPGDGPDRSLEFVRAHARGVGSAHQRAHAGAGDEVDGNPEPLQDLETDSALRAILEGTAKETGQQFFAALVQNLAKALGTHGAWVTEYFPEQRRLRALAFWMDGQWVKDYEVDIAGTPCEQVIDTAKLVHFPDRVLEIYPHEEELRQAGAVSYMGVPLQDTDGRILGHMAVIDRRPIPEEPRVQAIFQIFAARAAAEAGSTTATLTVYANAAMSGDQFRGEIAGGVEVVGIEREDMCD